MACRLDTTWIQNSSLWTDHAWTYTTHFTTTTTTIDAVAAKASTLLLTFDGVKMGATVRVNGHVLGVVRDQFLRYSFTLDPSHLASGAEANRLDVTFGVADVAEDGRFMACTGGWDWPGNPKLTAPLPLFQNGVPPKSGFEM